MSNIYGVFSWDHEKRNTILKHLIYWNGLCMGKQESRAVSERIEVGCYPEHFTDKYPAGSPVIQLDHYIAVIDAVIYNRETLFSALGMEDTHISDEELLLRYVILKGAIALNVVNGDFAGAFFDLKTSTWIVFRDHMGVRPLFYYMDKDTFVFSTDMRGIASISAIDTGINEAMLFKYAMGYNPLTQCETDFKNVFCIPTASWMQIDISDAGLQSGIHCYWELGSQPVRYKTDKEYQDKLYELVEDAVRIRLNAVSGVVGCELSGGLDSSVIAAMIGRSGREAKFFSWSRTPEEQPMKEGEDERRVILDICEQEGLSCQFHSGETAKALWEFQQSIDRRWPPGINTINILEGSLYLKSQGARVVFTGHGGDEGVSHRAVPYELWYHHEYLSFLKYFYQQRKGKKLRILRTLKALYHQFTEEHPKRKAPYKAVGSAGAYINQDFYNRMIDSVTADPLFFAYDARKYIMNGGSRSRLDNVALQGSAAGVRYMVPFLDYRVIDFAVSIPRAQFLDGYKDRKIYREAFKDLMPESLRNVFYKNIPSMQSGKEVTSEDIIKLKEHRRKQIADLAARLDRNMWEPYLKLDELENIDFSDEFTHEERELVYELKGLLGICLLTQDILLDEREEENRNV